MFDFIDGAVVKRNTNVPYERTDTIDIRYRNMAINIRNERDCVTGPPTANICCPSEWTSRFLRSAFP